VLVEDASAPSSLDLSKIHSQLDLVRSSPEELPTLLDTLVCDVLVTGILHEADKQRVFDALDSVKSVHRPVVIASPEDLLRPVRLEHPAFATELSVGQYTLSTEFMRLYRRQKPLHVAPSEFRVATLLMRHAGRPLTRTQIKNTVWGRESSVDERTVDGQVKRLRDALGGSVARSPIKSIRGVGYRWGA